MRLESIHIQNFRKLQNCYIDFSEKNTIFVGPNNSGKTSAMDALAKFLAGRNFVFNDFTLSNHTLINVIGKSWETMQCEKPDSLKEWSSILPSLDVCLDILPKDIYHVVKIIPTLKWKGGLLGVRLLYQPKNIEDLFSDYREAYFVARDTEKANSSNENINLFPKNLCEFLDQKINLYFTIKSYILDPEKVSKKENQPTDYEMECLTNNPLKDIVRIDIINAQRGFSDSEGSDGYDSSKTSLSSQLRNYYDKYLDPEKSPSPEDINILTTVEQAREMFDQNLKEKFTSAISELEKLGYPGISNPKITLKTKIISSEALDHDSAVQYALNSNSQEFTLPEKYNGLGYQNLISMVFHLISFRDGWMRIGKSSRTSDKIEPLHLVLIEEPEAHLHVQVQQVFIRKAYEILRNNVRLHDKDDYTTQMVVSTHSSHIAKEVEFKDLKYFKRLKEGKECTVATSKVVNLSDIFGKKNKTSKFATRYLQTTHCDLFFADAIILVEGVAENMLLPHFIRHKFPLLNQSYISILNVNGKHAHRLQPLINSLALPTLVITDIDSASSEGRHPKAKPERGKGLISGNYTITDWLIKKDLYDELLTLSEKDKVVEKSSVCKYKIRVAYQTPIQIELNNNFYEALSRTFEDSFIYENLKNIKAIGIMDAGTLLTDIHDLLNNQTTYEDLRNLIYKKLDVSRVKAEFALDLIYTMDPNEYNIPTYIKEGLIWLQNELSLERENGRE